MLDDKPQSFWKNALSSDEPKLWLFSKLCVHIWKNEAFKENTTIETVKYGGRHEVGASNLCMKQ